MQPQTTIAGHPEARIEHSRRLKAAILGAPWAERAVELGRGVLGDPDADPVTATLAASRAYATPRRGGCMWDHLWQDTSLADGTPRFSNALNFASDCRLGLDHGLRLRDAALDIARPEWVVDFGAGTGRSILPWVGVVDSLTAIEPADHFRTLGEAIVPEAQWFATAEDAPTVEGGVVALSFAHALNVGLRQADIDAVIENVAGAAELIIAEASNDLRASRLSTARSWIEAALERSGFERDWERAKRDYLCAGWGVHELRLDLWSRS